MFDPRVDSSPDDWSGSSDPASDSDGGGGTATAVAPPEMLSFEAETVTLSKSVTVSFQPDLQTGAATKALAAKMGLSPSTPYALRSNRTTRFLDDSRPLAEQISPGEKLTITPKAHLG